MSVGGQCPPYMALDITWNYRRMCKRKFVISTLDIRSNVESPRKYGKRVCYEENRM